MGRVGSRVSTPWGSTRASRGSARWEKATRGNSGGISMGRSLLEWTVKSTRPSRRARSSSLTNSPLPPIWLRGRSKMRSPVVFMVTSSTSAVGS